MAVNLLLLFLKDGKYVRWAKCSISYAATWALQARRTLLLHPVRWSVRMQRKTSIGSLSCNELPTARDQITRLSDNPNLRGALHAYSNQMVSLGGAECKCCSQSRMGNHLRHLSKLG